jgi:hypothetical protein
MCKTAEHFLNCTQNKIDLIPLLQRIGIPKHSNRYYLPRLILLYSLKIFNFLSLFVLLFQGGKTILAYYDYNRSKALIELFPDIGLQKQKFEKSIACSYFSCYSLFFSLERCKSKKGVF